MSKTTTSRILVPHDGSEMSDKALDKAIDFSKAFKSEIIILHIVDDRLIPSSAILGFIGEKSRLEDAKMQALNILKAGAEAMLKDRMEKVRTNGINVRFITGMGAPAEGIIDVAENEHVDLIVMGSRELKREKEYVAGKLKLLGSVARRVSEIAECPVMIIK
ncbi:MAG: universal stress protein [Thermoproteota archaeon]|nr:universal stress protein [Thermoproteota archaeon]